MDFLETMTMCQVLDKTPESVIFGVEPKDIETLSIDLTQTTLEKVDRMIEIVQGKLDRLGISYKQGDL